MMNVAVGTIENAVSDFLRSVWGRRNEILKIWQWIVLYEVKKDNLTPECVVNGTECYGG